MKVLKNKRGITKGTRFNDIKRSPFGNRLYKILRSKKISQQKLGEQIGVSNRMVSYYITNEVGPPLEILKKIAKVLQVTVSYLVDESPLKNVELDNTSPALKKDIDLLKSLPRKDQRTVSNTIEGLYAKNKLHKKEHENNDSGN